MASHRDRMVHRYLKTCCCLVAFCIAGCDSTASPPEEQPDTAPSSRPVLAEPTATYRKTENGFELNGVEYTQEYWDKLAKQWAKDHPNQYQPAELVVTPVSQPKASEPERTPEIKVVNERICVPALGLEGYCSASYHASVSADGSLVAFSSKSDCLVEGDTNSSQDVFVRDRNTGVTTRISVASDGTEANASSGSPVISSDGRYVAFVSYASNLAETETIAKLASNRRWFTCLYLHDRVTAKTSAVLPSFGHMLGNSYWERGYAMSANGQFVFAAVGDPAPKKRGEAFVYDTRSNHVQRFRLPTEAIQIDFNNLAISNDGRLLVFTGNVESSPRICVYDRTTQQVQLVGNATRVGQGYSHLSVTSDARFIAFDSSDRDLVPKDTNGKTDVFVYDRLTGTTRRVSVSSQGIQGSGDSSYPSISADGSRVAFVSKANNLVAGDDASYSQDDDSFVHDLNTGETRRVNLRWDAEECNGEIGGDVVISPSGGTAVFYGTRRGYVPNEKRTSAGLFAVNLWRHHPAVNNETQVDPVTAKESSGFFATIDTPTAVPKSAKLPSVSKELGKPKVISLYKDKYAKTRSAAFSPDGRLIVVSIRLEREKGRVDVYDTREGRLVNTLQYPVAVDAKFHEDSRSLLTMIRTNEELSIQKTKSGKPIDRWALNSKGPGVVRWRVPSHVTKRIVKQTVNRRDALTGVPITQFRDEYSRRIKYSTVRSPVNWLSHCFSLNGELFAGLYLSGPREPNGNLLHDRARYVWAIYDVSSGKKLQELSSDAVGERNTKYSLSNASASFSNDGKQFLCEKGSGVEVWDLDASQLTGYIKVKGGVQRALLSPDKRLLATSRGVYSVESGLKVADCEKNAVFLKDGQWLVSAGYHAITIHETQNRGEVLKIETEFKGYPELVSDPTGRVFAAISRFPDGDNLYLWPLGGRSSLFARALHSEIALRTWSTVDGGYSLPATLEAIDETHAWLRRKDKKLIRVARRALCSGDQEYLKKVSRLKEEYEQANQGSLTSGDAATQVAAQKPSSMAKQLTPEEFDSRVDRMRRLLEPRARKTSEAERRLHAFVYEALTHSSGRAGRVDFARQDQLLKKAADTGDEVGELMLRVFNVNDLTTTEATEAKTLFTNVWKKARNKDVLAVLACGLALSDGVGCEANQELAAKCMKWAAQQGDPDAMNEWAWRLIAGHGVDQRPAEGVVFLRLAAEKGSALAANGLAIAYFNGDGVARDLKRSVFYRTMAAERGYDIAQYNLGVSYENGDGVHKDMRAAAKWYQEAAAQGYSDAQLNLGGCYAKGAGVAKNDATALHWFQKAAAAGNPKALYNLAIFYTNGRGTPVDSERALAHLKAAADLGNERAIAALAGTAEPGQFDQQQSSQATPLRREAEHRGNEASERLGRRFREQLGNQGVFLPPN